MKGTNLDTFKIKPGRYKPHTLNRENFEKYTRKEHNVYVQIGKDGEKQKAFKKSSRCNILIRVSKSR